MLVRRASASARASLGPMFLIAKLTRKVIRDFKEGILVWECASTRLKRHDSLIWHNNISCSAFSPSQHSSIHILSLYLDLNSIAFFSNDRFPLIYPICSLFLPLVLLFVRKRKFYLFVFLQFISRFLFLFSSPLSSSLFFLLIPSSQPTLSHLSISLSILPLTPAQAKRDRWRPNADTPRPGSSLPSRFLCDGTR